MIYCGVSVFQMPMIKRIQHAALPHTEQWCKFSTFTLLGRRPYSTDPAGGGDHSGQPAGHRHDAGEDLSWPGPNCAIPGLPQHQRSAPHKYVYVA